MTPAREPMAIVGCGMRLPGGVHDCEAFWDFLINKKEGRCRVPADRYNVEAYHGPGKQGRVESEYGHFLSVDLAEMDSHMFSMSKTEIQEVDPQQRLALEVVYEALQNSGAVNYSDEEKRVGTYFGVFGEDFQGMQAKETLEGSVYRVSGGGDFAIANRVSFEFGFRGPSTVVRTACSSSLTALHDACLGIQNGECYSAVVGGTNLILTPYMTSLMSGQSIMAPDGRCKTFDISANGYARGEAVVAIHVKKLSDALKDNDPIRAVIRATCINSDGRAATLMQPNGSSHEELMRRSHELAGLDVADMAMIECHGTGTQIGDPIETKAVAGVFGDKGVLIGSVKPNFGHSEGASGVTSVIKTMLAMEKGVIAPNRNFEAPNPRIPFKEAGLVVPVEPTPWPHDRRQRVGVNSFGIGGANAHVLMESASDMGVSPTATQVLPGRHSLLVFSAAAQASLQELTQSHAKYLEKHPDCLSDLSYTLAVRREPLSLRTFAVVSRDDAGSLRLDPGEAFDFRTAMHERASNSKLQIVYTFTGQGAQYAQMATSLFVYNPVLNTTLTKLGKALATFDPPPSWSLFVELEKLPGDSRLAEAEISQPCCTAVQIGLVDVLKAWGLEPAAVIGHSSGEIAAAYASGAITAVEAMRVAYYRGLAGRDVVEETRGQGGMAAVDLGREDVTPFLKSGVVIACENSPSSVTLSGDLPILLEVMEDIKKERGDVLVRKLRVNCAYHSHHMQRVSNSYASSLGSLDIKKHEVKFFSSVTGELLAEDTKLDEAYWAKNLTSPVLFSQAATAAINSLKSPSTKTVFVEIGPHSALQGPLSQIFRANGADSSSAVYVPTLIRNQDSEANLLHLAGFFYQQRSPSSADATLDLERVVGTGRVLVDLPTYPWHRSGPYWSESRLSKAWRFQQHKHHELLGSRVVAVGDAEPAWRCLLSLDDVPWLRGHGIGEDLVFPGAGYVVMAGEAVQQLAGSRDGYTVRDVTIGNALILREGKKVEILTTVRPARLTTSLDSSWYDFCVYSYRKDSSSAGPGSWIKQAFGQVRPDAMLDQTHAVPDMTPLPRAVNADRWYPALQSRMGLHYHDGFRGLGNITTGVTERRAVAEINAVCHETQGEVSPETIDCMFQLFAAAAYHGNAHKSLSLAVPTFIGELNVGKARERISVSVEARADRRGGLHGTASAASTQGGPMVMRLNDLRLSPVDSQAGDDEAIRGDDPHAAVETVWRPDVNFLLTDQTKAAELIRPKLGANKVLAHSSIAERMALCCMVETSLKLAGLEPAPGNEFMEKYREWCGVQKAGALDGAYAYYNDVDDAQTIASMTSEQRCVLIDTLYAQLRDTGFHSVAEALHRIVNSCESLFSGEITALTLLLEGDVLSGIYDMMARATDLTGLFSLCAHYKPKLRVLEIGAGTGGTASEVLQCLAGGKTGGRMYFEYMYTDISAGFFAAAKERFKDYDGMDFRVLDISSDPVAQGFAPFGYDLILASNVLHATPYITKTLGNVRSLLAPGGKLFLQELCKDQGKWINYVMGTLKGWWLGEEDGRADEPHISVDEWDRRLKDAGFTGVETVHSDEALNVNIVAAAAGTKRKANRVTLLCKDSSSPEVKSLERVLLEKAETSCEVVQFASNVSLTPDQSIVCMLDLDTPFLHDMDEDQFKNFKGIIDTCKGSILWLTGLSSMHCVDPRYSMSIGLARTMRNELDLDFATLELETFDEPAWKAVVNVLEQFLNRLAGEEARNQEFRGNMEWVYAQGVVYVGRLQWARANDELVAEQQQKDDSEIRLEIGKYGLLSSLHWKPVEEKEQVSGLAAHEVDIDVKSIGLNFKDVLITIGLVSALETGDEASDDNGLGCEGAGIVTATGQDVRGLIPGDRVMFFGSGTFTSKYRTNEQVCVKIPERLGFEEAATMTAVYTTVLHSLLDKARVEKGMSVLVHSACGGVGIAAIQVCKMLGAEIYCTVSSDTKVKHLTETYNIPRDRIFNSRDASFLPAIKAATNGQGVDCVLNSLSGELLHASWQCVAEFGTMVEIGKRDFVGAGRLSMREFEDGRAYVGVDVARLAWKRMSTAKRLLQQIVTLYELGLIAPITPITSFEAKDVEDAMRFMQKGSHIGKVVITMPTKETRRELLAPLDSQTKSETMKTKSLNLSKDGSYILFGGLGGVGQALAVFLAEAGAGELVFMSRSAQDLGKYDALINELTALGCLPILVSGSVTNEEDVQRAFDAVTKPVKGVFHMSMVLNDSALANMSFSSWKAATDPKVLGAWNIHKAIVNLPTQSRRDLDFLFLISSLSGLFGQIGQANYAAANTFLDAFSQYCHRDKIPCATIDLGVVEDVGYVSRNAKVLNQFKQMACHVLQERDVLEGMQVMIQRAADLKAERGWGGPDDIAEKDVNGIVSSRGMKYVNKLQLGLGFRSTQPLAAATNRTMWKRDLSTAQYHNLESTLFASATIGKTSSASANSNNNEALQAFLQQSSQDPNFLTTSEAQLSLARQIRRTLNSFLLRRGEDDDDEDNAQTGDKGEEELRQPLSALGLDSLVAVELRNWFRQTLSVDVTVLAIVEASHLLELGRVVAERMGENLGSKEDIKANGGEAVNGIHAVNGVNGTQGVNGAKGLDHVNGVNGDVLPEKVARGEEWTIEGQLKMP